MENKSELSLNQQQINDSLTEPSVEQYRPCSSTSSREYGPYREVDTESVISKRTETTADNQEYSDTENQEAEKNEEKIDSDFEDYAEAENSESESGPLNTDESSSDSLPSENTRSQSIINSSQNMISDCEPISHSPFSRLTRTVRSYLTASNSYQILNSPQRDETPLSIFDSNISLSIDERLQTDSSKPKFETKSNLFKKILEETNEYFKEVNTNETYDFKMIYKLKELFSKYESYYATMLKPIPDNFNLNNSHLTKVCNKRMKHSYEKTRCEEDLIIFNYDEDEDEEEMAEKMNFFNNDSNSSDDSKSNQRYKNSDEFHLCSLCSHCLCEPITLICGCSFCKSCLIEYNKIYENNLASILNDSKNSLQDFQSDDLGDSELNITTGSHKRKHNYQFSNKANTYKCHNCSFLHENNSSQFLRQNVLLSKLVDKFWSKNVEIRKLRNDLRKYVCFVIETDLENFSLKKFEHLFLKAYELDPSNHLIFADLFMLNYFDNCNPNCLKYAESACELRPNWIYGFFMKSVYYSMTGDMNSLKINLDICLKLDPNLDQIKKNFSKKQPNHHNQKTSSCDSYLDNSQTSTSTYDLYSFNDSTQTNEIPNQLKSSYENETQNQSALKFDTSKYVVVNSHLVKSCELECSLCYRLLYKPVTTPCGHSFCCSCLDRSLDHQDKCPLCKHSLADYLAERRQFVTIFLEKLIVDFYSNEHEDRKKQFYDDMKDLIGDENEIPVFVCTLGMPNIPCPLHIFEPRYKLMLRRAIETEFNQFGMCMYSEKTPYHYTEYGCMLEIKSYQFIRDGRAVVTTVGGRRFKVLSSSTKDGYNVAKVEWVKDVKVESESEKNELHTLHDDVYRLAQTWFNFIPEMQKERILNIFNISELPAPEKEIQTDNGPTWHWILLNILPIENSFQYKFLTKTSLKERLLPLKKILWMLLMPNKPCNPVNTPSSTLSPTNSLPNSDSNNYQGNNSDNSSTNGIENSSNSIDSDLAQTTEDPLVQRSL